MLYKLHEALGFHIKNNSKKYIWLMAAFTTGILAGAFTVNGLSFVQREELNYYFLGFLQLLSNQDMEGIELLKLSLMQNLKLVGILWVLGVTIIGIPFIFFAIGIKGFITGFTSGFIIQSAGYKGLLFTLLGLLPKEIIVVPCIIALGVFGINFSLSIIKNKNKHFSKESLKNNFLAYCLVTLMFCCIIFVGALMEAYIIPVFIKWISPVIVS